MFKYLKYFAIVGLVLSFSACNNIFQPNNGSGNGGTNQNYTSDEFKKHLSHCYKTKTDSHGQYFKIHIDNDFAHKADQCMKGYEVKAISPYRLGISNMLEREELITGKAFLDNVIGQGMAPPKTLADLQFYYDCWANQSKYTENGYHTTSCKRKFQDTMKQISEGCRPRYIVEFGPECSIGTSGAHTIKRFASHIGYNGNSQKVLIAGHADKARKVADMLVNYGVDRSRIKIVVSQKIGQNVGLYNDDEYVRYCFKNSHVHYKPYHHTSIPHSNAHNHTNTSNAVKKLDTIGDSQEDLKKTETSSSVQSSIEHKPSVEKNIGSAGSALEEAAKKNMESKIITRDKAVINNTAQATKISYDIMYDGSDIDQQLVHYRGYKRLRNNRHDRHDRHDNDEYDNQIRKHDKNKRKYNNFTFNLHNKKSYDRTND